MKKIVTVILFLLVCYSVFAEDNEHPEINKNKPLKERYFTIGLGPEMNKNTREGVAGGAGLIFGFDLNKHLGLGIKTIYSNNFDTIQAIEPLAFFKYYPLVKGLFLQADAGGIIFFEDGGIYPAFSGGGAVGWRFVFKNNMYLEPYVRGGYPFAFGVGVNLGYKIPLKNNENREAATTRRTELAREITSIIEEQNIKDASVEVSDEGVMIRLSNIQFVADSTRIPETETAKIVEIAGILKSFPNRKILVAGHTADTGTGNRIDELRLSHDRTMVVMSLLIQHGGINDKNISVIGYGSDRPIADNSTEEGRAINRRVEIIILE